MLELFKCIINKKNWILTRYCECQKINRITHNHFDSVKQTGQDSLLFTKIKCPFCNKINQIKKSIQRVIWYNYAFSFNTNEYRFKKNPIPINKNILQFIPQYYPKHNCEK